MYFVQVKVDTISVQLLCAFPFLFVSIVITSHSQHCPETAYNPIPTI